MRKSVFLVFALVCLISLGCDGSSTGAFTTGQCGSFTPCGGAITGTWKLAGTCYGSPDAGAPNADAGTSNCTPQQSTTSTQLNGTISFKTDGTYSASTTMSGGAKFTYTASCLTSVGMTCDQLNSGLASNGTADAGVTASCSSKSAGGCACTETFTGASSNETGTYTTSGSALTMTSSTSTSTSPQDPTEYCVQGNRLTIRVTSASSGSTVIITATR